MSHDILLQLGTATLAASAAIILVLLTRKPIAKLFGPHIAYAFWLMVPVAAIASFIPAEQVSQLVPTVVQGSAQAVEVLRPAVMGPNVVSPLAAIPVLELDSAIAKPNTPLSTMMQPASILLALWLMGALFSVAGLAYRQSKFLGGGALSRIGSRFYRASENNVGPAAVGVLKARVVVPGDFSERYSTLERKLIVDHEREHIRFGDVRINALAAGLQCLNWFNPLVYLAVKSLREDQELACDARVMKKHTSHKRVYAEALLKAQFGDHPVPVGCAWPIGGRHSLKHRITTLGQQPSSTIRKMTGVLACVTTVALTSQAVRAMIPAETVYIQEGVGATDLKTVVSALKQVKPFAKVQSNNDSDNLTDALGMALVEALSEGRRGHARELIKAGADANFYKRGDGTPLVIAANGGDRKTVRLLLEAGADASKPAPGDGSPLIAAANRGDADMVKLLIDSGADVNGYVPGDGTPLIAAIQDGDAQSIRMLLDAGADVNKAAPGDGSPLIAASGRGYLELVTLLVEKGANVNGYVDGDETPLINAASENEIDVARFLIENGADVNLAVEATDRNGQTIMRSPLGQAERFGNDRMVALLKENDAKPVDKEN